MQMDRLDGRIVLFSYALFRLTSLKPCFLIRAAMVGVLFPICHSLLGVVRIHTHALCVNQCVVVATGKHLQAANVGLAAAAGAEQW